MADPSHRHRGDDNPGQWPRELWAEDMELMREATGVAPAAVVPVGVEATLLRLALTALCEVGSS